MYTRGIHVNTLLFVFPHVNLSLLQGSQTRILPSQQSGGKIIFPPVQIVRQKVVKPRFKLRTQALTLKHTVGQNPAKYHGMQCSLQSSWGRLNE